MRQRSKSMGYEVIEVDGAEVTFRANFSFLVYLKEISGLDPIAIHEQVNNGDPLSVKNVLMASLQSDMENKESFIEDCITKSGFQECAILAQWLLNAAMIGDVKKKQISNNQKMNRLLDQFVKDSLSKNLKNHLLLWGYLLTASMACVCLSIKITSELFI